MKLKSRLYMGIAAATLAAGAYGAEPAGAPPMEEVVVTAKYPYPMIMEEVIVTAKYPYPMTMEEVVVTTPRPAELVAAEAEAPSTAATEDDGAAASHEALRGWLLERVPAPPRRHF